VNLLPIPRQVGEAIMRYLRHRRPPTASRFIFIAIRKQEEQSLAEQFGKISGKRLVDVS
jgi:hypothetical protein